MKDVVIVGSGPAGLSAAVYTSRAGFSTAIVKGDNPGGLLTTTEQIDNYLGMFGTAGMDMADIFLDHAVKFGATFTPEIVSSIVKNDKTFVTTLTDGSNIESRAVVFAAGSTPRKLGVDGEGELSGVSYCATCDGMFFEGDSVAVVGGGETAAEDALYLSQLASEVHVFVRSHWRATEPAIERLLARDNVTVHLQENVVEILGEEGNVSGVTTDKGNVFDVSGVFVAVGQSPNSKTAADHVVLYEDGFISHPETLGFFVGGDISTPEYRQVIVAAGEGAKAGIDATRFLLS